MVLPARKAKIINSLFDPTEGQDHISYMLSAMCQTSLPFKDMGDEVRQWENKNGNVGILIKAGSAFNAQNEFINVGLPYGAKPRLILSYLNTRAILTQSPVIEVEQSLKQFIEKLGLHAKGSNFKTVKDQLARLSASDIMIGISHNDRTTNVQGHVIKRFDLWFPKDENQRVLWPAEIELSKDYFESLISHAVPLDERALALLKDSAVELDVYAMLAERLHRIDKRKPQFVPWGVLWKQYGKGYKRCGDFRRKFTSHLKNVLAVYPDAKVDADETGLFLYNSKPPIRKSQVQSYDNGYIRI